MAIPVIRVPEWVWVWNPDAGGGGAPVRAAVGGVVPDGVLTSLTPDPCLPHATKAGLSHKVSYERCFSTRKECEDDHKAKIKALQDAKPSYLKWAGKVEKE